MRIATILLTAGMLLPTAVHAQTLTPLQATNEAAKVDSATQASEARLGRDQADRMTVAVRVAGTGPYRFVVDTGADRTVVARELADRLRLPNGPGATLHSISGVDTIRTARVRQLEYTAKKVDGINAAVLEGSNIGADGILGTDSLKAQQVLFDFKLGTLVISSSRRPSLDEPGTIVVEARRRAGRLILTDARVEGRGVAVVVDTGSDLNIGNPAMAAMLRRKGLMRGEHSIELTSVTGGKVPGTYTFLRELELGGTTLTNVAIVFADAHTFRQLKLGDKPAMLLGMNAMRAFQKVSIDFANRKLHVLVPKGSARDGASELASR